jgi:hypothetical protein
MPTIGPKLESSLIITIDQSAICADALEQGHSSRLEKKMVCSIDGLTRGTDMHLFHPSAASWIAMKLGQLPKSIGPFFSYCEHSEMGEKAQV